MGTLYDFTANAIDGRPLPLSRYRGRVVLVVNTASRCGFTPQYEGLQGLHDRLHDRGLDILCFPCNQFGRQEPGTAADIAGFCQRHYGVSFQMFEKVDVNGDDAHPLFRWLKDERRGFLSTRSIKWNFTKFLVDRDGRPVARYATMTPPAKLAAPIERLL
jgi:glutathione peroxidase